MSTGSKRKINELDGLSSERDGFGVPLKKQKVNNTEISFTTQFDQLFSNCEANHKCHLDKLYGNKLCVSCDEYYTKREQYLEAIQTIKPLKCLETLKYVLLSYLIHHQTKYHTKIVTAYPKYQMMMDQWYINTFTNQIYNKKQSIGIIKKTMKKLSIDAYMDLLVRFQPWITIKEVNDIIQYQLQNTGKQLMTDKEFCDKLCNGCYELIDTNRKCWMCHMAIKAMLLLYFTTDLHQNAGHFFLKVRDYIRGHHVPGACEWFWSVSQDWRSIQLLGFHPVKNHIINQMNWKQNDEYLLKPPIITRQQLVEIQEQMMQDLVRGYSYISSNNHNINDANGVWLANESGKLTLNIT
eukprot:556274_1